MHVFPHKETCCPQDFGCPKLKLLKVNIKLLSAPFPALSLTLPWQCAAMNGVINFTVGGGIINGNSAQTKHEDNEAGLSAKEDVSCARSRGCVSVVFCSSVASLADDVTAVTYVRAAKTKMWR